MAAGDGPAQVVGVGRTFAMLTPMALKPRRRDFLGVFLLFAILVLLVVLFTLAALPHTPTAT